MDTDKYTIKGSRLESILSLTLTCSGGLSPLDAIAIIAAVEAAANGRPVDGTRWTEECQAMLSAKEDAQ